ncbi:ABC transporter ATP-binding protein [Citreicella sp. C3M06]|uniref:ABC transporter ATP-binding protein n=1 Tax=Citreicella sp. C3M06 TaxID=2841564 RepID=UPI001C08BA1F|nr:ABC transporter ATP-binding protein [Citreicella sp. C3M06]MBU2960222.1 ABC transporter ATP-binding protein [Citreicella sp. C3M06]
MNPETLLQVQNLSIEFGTSSGRLRALRGIDLEVPKGRIMGLVGESGCGKSTLAYSLSGLLAGNGEVSGGAILFDGADVTKMSDKELRDIRGRRVSMIFQDPMTALNPVITIGRQMLDIQYREPGTNAEKRARAARMLERVGIPDAAAQLGSYPHQFSGGMRQRVCIAMALLTKPDLLIADEPTTALDATLEVQIIELLRELQQEMDCAIVFVSHHLGTVAELCDDVTLMYAGEVVERGSVRDVFHNPAHPYTQALLECDPARMKVATRQLPTIPGMLPNLVDVPQGCIFASRCQHVWERCRSAHPHLSKTATVGHRAACHLLDAEGRT